MTRQRGLPGDASKPAFVFALIFFVLAAGILIAGWFSYRKSAQHFRAEVERELSAIAELKVGELVLWRQERLADGGIMFKNATLSALVRRVVEKPADADAQRKLQNWFGKYEAHYQYDEVRLLDTQGVTRLSAPAGLPAVTAEVVEHAAEASRSGQVTIQDFYRSTHDQQIRLAVLIPILDEADGNRPLGVLVLCIDPAKYLYPFIQRWPTPSATAETLLVRREGNEAVFLNELRFQTNTALNLRSPLDRVTMPAVQAALGREGIMEGVDYRGVPVMAALRTVPDSPWALVARIDAEEVYAPLHTQLWQVIVMVGVLLFSAGAGVGLVWRQQRVRFYRKEAESAEELKASEELFRTVSLSVTDIVYEWDLKETLIWYGNIDGIMGYPPQGFPRTLGGWATTLHPEDKERVWKAVEGQLKGATPYALEYRIRNKNGEWRWWSARGTALRDGRGEPYKWIGAISDITEHKQEEQTLLKSRKAALNIMTDAVEARDRAEQMSKALRLKNLVFDASIAANSIADMNGNITEANEAFLRVWGYPSKDEVIGKPLLHFVNDYNDAVAIVTALNSTGQWEGDYLAKRKDGSTFVAYGLATTIKDEKGTVIGYQSAVMDVTGQRDAEKELKKHRDHLEQLIAERTEDLKKSEERFRTVADFTYDWEYWADAQRRLLYISPSCERITGYTQEEFYKYPTLIDTIVHPDDLGVFQAHVDDYHIGTKRTDSTDWSFRIIDSRGNMHWIGHVCRPITGEDGTYKGRRVSNRDITEGKKAEMAIQGFNESLRRNNAELQALNSELEGFAYSVSHDLRAPLRTIDGFSHALLEDYEDKLGVQGKDYLRRVRASTQRMAQLIDDILKLSRITRSEMNIEKVNLTQIAWSIIDELQKSQPERLINIKIAEGLEDTADPRLMRVALENLLGNAWKFTGKQSEAVIEFGSTKEGEKKVYFIRDNGAGFDMAYADKLFAPFQRLHTTEEYAGTGIGLATVQRIARRHGGKAWAEGQVDKGATFYFSLQ
ncbi:MAG: PAS domain-containing protein [Candidatus Aminicenantes bacterium]|nr:PAS domain-containing protein [Candidatus Aminicenantes bacterium]